MRKVLFVLKWLLIAILIILALAIIYEQYTNYSAKRSFVDNGTYTTVNGHKMHYVKKGNGQSTVIFEAGLDSLGHLSWTGVQNEVSKYATTISYDRAGILRSEVSNNKRTCENMTEELHMLLENIEAKKPYTLVVHSMGGLIARCYSKKYPQTLSGIVFVDASHPDQIQGTPSSLKEKIKFAVFHADWFMSLLVYSGLLRVNINKFIDRLYKDDPTKKTIKKEANAYLMKSSLGAISELKMFEHIAKEAKGAKFGNIPFTILSAHHDSKNKDERNFIKLQKESLKLSTKSKLITVESGHYIQLEKPNVVIDAINVMIETRAGK